MGLNSTPSGERTHIGFFGQCNAGKSSLVNAVTSQDLAVVSDIRGTTTDPVYKSMELLPLGPVVIIDTPGFNDIGELGELRIRKAKQVLNKTDVAVLVVDGTSGLTPCDRQLIDLFRQKEIPYLIALNKRDLVSSPFEEENSIWVSAVQKEGIHELKERIAHLIPEETEKKHIVSDLISPSDFVILVVPIDTAAPKGRLILPQQQTIRDILETGATAIVVKESELKETISGLSKRPSLVITDSQVFSKVSEITPRDIPLTSFSILMARYKGFLEEAVRGITAIDHLQDGDTILISEGCTHHRQCDDIGTVKIPRWLEKYTGKNLHIETTSGTKFPDDLSRYALIIHCGGCMLNPREVRYRMKCAVDQNIPITNYGILIAAMKGILKRSLEIFPSLLEETKGDGSL